MMKIKQKLFSEIYQDCYVKHDKVVSVEKLIQFCFDSFDGITEPTCLLLIGDSGLGKSLIAKEFHKKYPDYDLKLKDVVNTVKPIVRFSLPSNAKRYEAIRAFLREIGDPRWDSGDSFDLKNDRLIHYLVNICKTQLIFIDEFHHLTQSFSTSQVVNTGEWLKLLIKETNIPIVGLGMPWAQRIQTTNKQIGSIFTMVEELFPFRIDNTGDLDTYCGFLNTVAIRAGKRHSIKSECLVNPEVLLPLFIASEGSPKLLMKLIANAFCLSDRKELKLIDFNKAFRFVFASSKNNPFVSNYKELSAHQVESNPYLDLSRKQIMQPSVKIINIRDVFNLGRSEGFW
ncbi:TniB family NTP-binding protein [Endozoicomonas euniceicola]|uniref:TniB family NTP-binding protein n=1 Tax=Endozoicomonas euniceicola TaxID=1234143 RepID=A0ABY6GYB0_9GAMM|nr:TniB family NTP-binding protein [Endozoicomonas euniceicola]UYM17670.1 TniB family NTP-binding protein [Endozoicomonas euniceicola]